MALGFGATLGTASTDRVVSATEAAPTLCSIHIWTNRNGEGPSSFGRMISRSNGVFDLANNHGNVANTYAFGNINANVYWNWTRPSVSVWTPIGISVDTSSPSNNPIVYQGGTKLTVGSGLTQVGVDTAYVVTTTPWCIGNRPSDNLRNWDGTLAEFAIWNVILTDAEFASLAAGADPSTIQPSALIHYVPMVSGGTDTKGASWTVTGTAVQSHPPGVPTVGGSSVYGKVNVGGSWKTVSAIQVNVGGVWKSVTAVKVNVSGLWKSLA